MQKKAYKCSTLVTVSLHSNRNPKTLPIALDNVLILKLIVSVPEFLFVFNFLTSNYVYVSEQVSAGAISGQVS